MDILAHGLWAVALYMALNLHKKNKKPLLSLKWAFFWGVFPDLFAFVPMFIWRTWQSLMGRAVPFGRPVEPSGMDTLPIYNATHGLYSLSHSLVVFLIAFALVFYFYKVCKKPNVFITGGWLLHIFCDVPTHSYRFFPTPVLWPISAWKFNGISWGTPWFMALNYSALFVAYVWLFRKK